MRRAKAVPAAVASDPALEPLLAEVRGCQLCASALPNVPRPIFQAGAGARLLIVGQAPGVRAHTSGRPFTDPSGVRLRKWLGLDEAAFYDANRVALLPAGFCYPGTNPKGGDYPPRPECAPHWHPRLRPLLTAIGLTVLVGQYAHTIYLAQRRRPSVTETVAAWRDYLPDFMAMPHPSWRVNGWLARNPWFDAELVPELRRRVKALIG
jgi:uracil-DNA glycosylase